MSARVLLILCCVTVMFSSAKAQTQKKKNDTQHNISATVKLMDARVSELMADRVTFNKDLILKEAISTEEYNSELAQEELMFPADDLYGSNWDTRWVDPFKGEKIEFPDSCAIDCSTFVIPVDSQIKITSKYGPRRRRMHRGIDLKVQIGDTIRAAFDGKVRIRNFERRGYGNYLVVRHPNGLETVYGHLSKALVNVDQVVRAGQPIALGGNTGRSTGSHLHFETRFLGQAINPAEIIDFENGVPHQDMYVFHNVKINGRKSNIYTSSDNQMVYHRVKSGDYLEKIARMYGTTVDRLCELNGLKKTSVLRVGQSIRCSVGGAKSSPKTTGKQQIKKTTVEADAAAVASLPENRKKINQQSGDVTPIYHRIQSGDTLSDLAVKYRTTVSKLCELNGIKKNTILKLGASLRCS